jgi:hypothetical protein
LDLDDELDDARAFAFDGFTLGLVRTGQSVKDTSPATGTEAHPVADRFRVIYEGAKDMAQASGRFPDPLFN